jgi:isopenicillin N synthase-like dioxygenase
MLFYVVILCITWVTVDSVQKIDIHPLLFDQYSPDAENIRVSLRQALQDDGIAIIRGNGIESQDLDRNRDVMHRIFDLPLDQKLNLSLEQAYGRGYIASGKESGLAEIYEPKEGYSYGYPWSAEVPAENNLTLPNVWPGSLHEDDINQLQRYFHQNVILALLFKSILSDSSSLIASGDTISIMRVFHYHRSVERNCLGSSPHTDWGYLTIISQDDIGGLQYYDDGIWKDVVASKDELIINVGDYLSFASNGTYRSPIHRVLCPKHSDRLSFVFFYYPSYDSYIDFEITQATSAAEHQQGREEKLAFNSMFDGSLRGNVKKSFGDYIMEKWNGVYRS